MQNTKEYNAGRLTALRFFRLNHYVENSKVILSRKPSDDFWRGWSFEAKRLRTMCVKHGGSNPTITDGRFKNHRWFESTEDFRPRDAGDIIRLNHTGWYVDEEPFQDETTHGIVLRLPHGRGFLAGCTDPWNDGSALVEMDIIADEDTAARCADRIAEIYAEDCREDNAKQREEMEAEEAEQLRQAEIDNLP